ncbi:MAG TPA: hypothetical protein VI790_01350 [Candidatus Nanoarchaeia archaeon]|nr:hypothetical protein [Candidatus Nanoarchaeia archaeon]
MIEIYQERINEYYSSIDETNVTFSSEYKISFNNIVSLSKEAQFFGLEPFYDGIAQRIKQLNVKKGGLITATEYYLDDLAKLNKQ